MYAHLNDVVVHYSNWVEAVWSSLKVKTLLEVPQKWMKLFEVTQNWTKMSRCSGFILYGGRIKSYLDTAVINLVGSLLHCIMDSYHKISLVCLTALFTSDTSLWNLPAIITNCYFICYKFILFHEWRVTTIRQLHSPIIILFNLQHFSNQLSK